MKKKAFSRSLRYALFGLGYFLKYEYNARIQVLITIATIGLSFFLHLSILEWLFIISSVFSVLSSEIINTAIEGLADLVAIRKMVSVKIIKDLAAAYVVMRASYSLVIAGVIFLPKIYLLIWR